MIEIPEAATLVNQLNKTVKGRIISKVTTNSSPHKFAWFSGDPKKYHEILKGKKMGKSVNRGGMVEIEAGDKILLFTDGINLRFIEQYEKIPKKHQLLIEFEDKSLLIASVQMYGGLWCCDPGEFDNEYYQYSYSKPSPLSDQFDQNYFENLVNSEELKTKSVKALLATEQRIPGLGNGVLQDILYNSKIHPKRRVDSLSTKEINNLYRSVKKTLKEMTEQGGRDTEKDLFGEKGGYVTKLCRNTVGKICLQCGDKIVKQNYMGGSIYFCGNCQKNE
ncbi:MAG: formamidopyrimidine-DNA glycosylase [Candidatus Cloacimonas sp. SDB]|nr:MAG: formamidopyrimidine-DNA glycosylase [Candidatus Cloacimonas sp. SDB]